MNNDTRVVHRFLLPDEALEDLMNIPRVDDTHYYSWLLREKKLHVINSRRKYLEGLGFIYGFHTLDEQQLLFLKLVFSYAICHRNSRR